MIRLQLLITIVIFTFSVVCFGQKQQWIPFNLKAGEQALQLWNKDKDLLLVTNKRIINLQTNTDFLPKCDIKDYSILNNRIYLGTKCGVEFYDLTQKKGQSIAGFDFEVENICIDFLDVLWVEGNRKIYRYSDGEIEEVQQINQSNDIAATPDGSTWFATSIGLFQLIQPTQTFNKTRNIGNKAGWYHHEEETRRGFEIPDNYVDRLYGHGQTILWIKTAEFMTVVDLATRVANAGHGHLPNLNAIGKKNNEIYDIQYFSDLNYIIICTKLGVFGMSKFEMDKVTVMAHNSGSKEIYNNKDYNALVSIDLKTLNTLAEDLQANPILGVTKDGKGNLYFFNAHGYTKLKKARTEKVLPAPNPEEYQQFLLKQHVHFVQTARVKNEK